MVRPRDMNRNFRGRALRVLEVLIVWVFFLLIVEILIDHLEEKEVPSHTVDDAISGDPLLRVFRHWHRVGDFIRNYLTSQDLNIKGSIQNEENKRDTKEEAL